MNRLEKYFRDPTLDELRMDYYMVRTLWQSFRIGREAAADVIAAVNDDGGSNEIVRCQTIHGSVVHLRIEAIISVVECTRAQREAERRFWKELDEEEDEF